MTASDMMKMIWNFEYNPIFPELVMTCGKRGENLKRAYEKAKEHFNSDNHENFIVIRVENYDCVAYVIDEFNPISISRDIFPFDAERVYPMQGLKIEPRFMTFHECLSEM